MEESAIFVKLENPQKAHDKVYSIHEKITEAINLIAKIESAQSKEQEILEKWQKSVNQASLNLKEAEKSLPKGTL